jgi:hypothetical protein
MLHTVLGLQDRGCVLAPQMASARLVIELLSPCLQVA